MKRKLNVQFVKNCLCLATGLLVLTTFANAQKSGDAPFHKGSKVVGLFIGAGSDYVDISGRNSVPFIFGASYDQGFFDNVGPGNIGIGGVVAYGNTKYNYTGGHYKYNNLIIAARGTYHLTLLADKNPKFDPYGGVTIGFSIYDDNDPSYSYNSSATVFGLFVGAKYNFTPKFGAFAEAGFDYAFIRGGVAFNF